MSETELRAGDLLDPTSFRSATESWLTHRDAIMRDVNAQRSEAMAAMILGLGRLILRALRVVAWPLTAIWQAVAFARVCETLNSFDDAELNRLGITRQDIPNHAFAAVYDERKPVLEAIKGGKSIKVPAVVTPERRAA